MQHRRSIFIFSPTWSVVQVQEQIIAPPQSTVTKTHLHSALEIGKPGSQLSRNSRSKNWYLAWVHSDSKHGPIPDGDQESGDRSKYQTPWFLGQYKGQPDYQSPNDGGDKTEFTEEREDTRKALITYIQDTHIFQLFPGEQAGTKGKLAG